MKGSKPTATIAQKDLNPGYLGAPPSPFVLFMAEFKKQFTERFPDGKSNFTVGKEGGAKWVLMSDSEKAPYVERAAVKKLEYDSFMEKKEEGKPSSD